jgi:hypothetical protein
MANERPSPRKTIEMASEKTIVSNNQFHLRRLSGECFVLISEGEYAAIVEARQGLRELLGVEQKFDVMLGNYVELEEAVFHESLRHLVFSEVEAISFQQRRHHLSRRILNLLASCRLYLDGLRKQGSIIFGKSDKLSEELKAATSAEYDRSLAYRAMEALRNHAQHFDLPVHGISAEATWDEHPPGSRLSYSFVPWLSKNGVSRDSTFKKPLLDQLFAKNDQIELMPLVREYVDGLGRVHVAFRKLSSEKEQKWEKILQKAISLYEEECSMEESSRGILVALPMDGNNPAGEPTYVELGDQRIYLKKNRNLANFSKRYVKW